MVASVLRAMMKHAVEVGLRADDPTQDVRAIRVKSDGFHSWTEPRLAFTLLLYTGQRRSDVVRTPNKAADAKAYKIAVLFIARR